MHDQFDQGQYGHQGVNLKVATSPAASLSVYLCPTRRSGVNQSSGTGAATCTSPGATGDYSIVVDSQCFQWSYLIHDPWPGDPTNCGEHAMHQAIRPAEVKNDNYESPEYESRFRDITDGTSHTALLCEKHIHQDMLNKCCGHGIVDIPSDECQAGRDGNIYYYQGDLFRDYNTQSSARYRIARSPNDGRGETLNEFDRGGLLSGGPSIGNWHPGICHFLMADGSVQALSVMTPIHITELMTRIQNGEPFQLPY